MRRSTYEVDEAPEALATLADDALAMLFEADATTLEAFESSDPAAAVATVSAEPPNEVITPAPLSARVTAEPPSWVTSVKTFPPSETAAVMTELAAVPTERGCDVSSYRVYFKN